MKRAWIVTLALVLGAGFLRLAHQVEIARNDILARAPAGDERTFVEWAHAVATRSDDRVPYQSPLYPSLLGALERTGADLLPDARLLQALLGLAAAGLGALAAWETTRDRRVALVAFALAAFARPLIHAEGTLLRESSSAAVLAAIAVAYARSRERARLDDHAALGLALGIGLVLRENFLVVAAIVLAERALALARATTARARLAILILVCATALPLVPFDLKVARLGGGIHAIPSWNQGCVFYLANRRDNGTEGGYEPPPFVHRGNPEGEVEGFAAEAKRRTGMELAGHALGDYWLRIGLREVAAAPGLFAWRVAHRLLTSLAPWETAHQRDLDADAECSWVLRAPLVDMGVLIPLAIVGALSCLPRPRPREAALLLLAWAWWLSLLGAAFTTRYRVPAVPLLAVLAALGARSIARGALEGKVARLAAFAAIIMMSQGLRAFRAPPDHANALRTRGLAALDLASRKPEGLESRILYDAAASNFAHALASRPGDVDLLLLLAEASGPRDPVTARAAYASVVALDPGRSGAWHGLGICELGLGRPHAAIAALEHADASDPAVRRHLELARERAAGALDRPIPLPRR